MYLSKLSSIREYEYKVFSSNDESEIKQLMIKIDKLRDEISEGLIKNPVNMEYLIYESKSFMMFIVETINQKELSLATTMYFISLIQKESGKYDCIKNENYCNAKNDVAMYGVNVLKEIKEKFKHAAINSSEDSIKIIKMIKYINFTLSEMENELPKLAVEK